ncbi:MAG: PorP/SprF family type IX secretion system membrane protein [Cyclobacteriaceae bacterium]
MRFFKYFFLFVLFWCVHNIYAQNYPLYNGYFLNPFIFNPAAAATERMQLTLDYRKQWLGISGAPTVSSLTLSTLLNESRAGVGFKATSISRGFLNTTDASLSYAYGVPFDKDNKIFFGISGGILTNTINTSEITNVNDPALKNISSGIIPNASFGMLFQNSNGFNFGFTLPKLISDPSLNSKYSFTYFDNAIVTASYNQWRPQPVIATKGKKLPQKSKKKVTSVPLELYAIYRYSAYGSLIEGTAKYNFSPNIWLSAGYRQYSGIIPGLGINMDNLSFSYFYEPGIGGDLPLKTHEVMLRINLGKTNKFKEKPVEPPTSKVKLSQDYKVAMAKKEEPKKIEAKRVEPPKPEVKQEVKPQEKVVQTVVVKPVEKKDTTAQTHVSRFKPSATAVDSSALKKAHEEERKQLDQHIQDHAEGKHDDEHNQPVNQRHDFVKRGTHHEELEAATYVIAGAFQSRVNAEHYAKTLKSLGYDADFGHLSVRKLWYVFIAEEKSIPDAKNERDRLQKNKIFSQVWLLTVQE